MATEGSEQEEAGEEHRWAWNVIGPVASVAELCEPDLPWRGPVYSTQDAEEEWFARL